MFQNNKQTLQKFKRNYWGVCSFIIIAIISLLSIFAYVISPDSSVDANNGDITISTKPPGFTVQTITIKNPNKSTFIDYFTGKKNPDVLIPILSYSLKNDSLKYFTYADDQTLSQEKYLDFTQYPSNDYQISEKKYWLGTDNQGRDYLSRLLVGSRVSLAIGFVAVAISLLVGITLGAISGYFGGKVDAFILWLINIIWSIPTLLLVIAITLALGKGFWQVFIAVGLTMWVEVARVVRGQVMSVKQMQYVTAAKALGYSDLRIIFKHILPNAFAPVIVISAANFASAILVESGLSFLGLGAQVPIPSWGGMIKEHYNYILLGKPYLALIPGAAMCLLVVSFMMIGNALRDALDVKN